ILPQTAPTKLEAQNCPKCLSMLKNKIHFSLPVSLINAPCTAFGSLNICHNTMDEKYDIITDEEAKDISEALENSTLATAAEKIQEYFNLLDHTTLNIAITGESGSGKSTFVNAFRGIGDDDGINSAPTGVVETTMDAKCYPHPKYPSVRLWNLPGIGTPNFKADTYLQDTMEKELPMHKRHVFLLSLPSMSQKIIEKKKAALKADVWKMAVLSGAIAAIPIPGLSIAVDVTILVKEISRYYKAFGLDDDSLRNLSGRTGVTFEDLKSDLKSPLNEEITADVVIKLLTKAAGGGLMVLEYLVSNIPVFGSMAAGGISYWTTYYMLDSCLNELAEDSQSVLMKALLTPV
uniref:IRG-type G domain-containing protein n=1 Tax=Paramormyrops kingsleyae TaxID=1676925 RepID=A0A3B3SQ59_9TELE